MLKKYCRYLVQLSWYADGCTCTLYFFQCMWIIGVSDVDYWRRVGTLNFRLETTHSVHRHKSDSMESGLNFNLCRITLLFI